MEDIEQNVKKKIEIFCVFGVLRNSHMSFEVHTWLLINDLGPNKPLFGSNLTGLVKTVGDISEDLKNCFLSLSPTIPLNCYSN